MSEEWRIESAVVGSAFRNPPIGKMHNTKSNTWGLHKRVMPPPPVSCFFNINGTDTCKSQNTNLDILSLEQLSHKSSEVAINNGTHGRLASVLTTAHTAR